MWDAGLIKQEAYLFHLLDLLPMIFSTADGAFRIALRGQ
jgi:hypothetical protein